MMALAPEYVHSTEDQLQMGHSPGSSPLRLFTGVVYEMYPVEGPR
jgi:hypothetical protein